MSSYLANTLEDILKLNAADLASSAIGSEAKIAYLGTDQQQTLMNLQDFACNTFEAVSNTENIADLFCGLSEYWIAPEHGEHALEYMHRLAVNTAVELSEDVLESYFEAQFEDYLRGVIPDYDLRWQRFYQRNKKGKKNKGKHNTLGYYLDIDELAEMFSE